MSCFPFATFMSSIRLFPFISRVFFAPAPRLGPRAAVWSRRSRLAPLCCRRSSKIPAVSADSRFFPRCYECTFSFSSLRLGLFFKFRDKYNTYVCQVTLTPHAAGDFPGSVDSIWEFESLTIFIFCFTHTQQVSTSKPSPCCPPGLHQGDAASAWRLPAALGPSVRPRGGPAPRSSSDAPPAAPSDHSPGSLSRASEVTLS